MNILEVLRPYNPWWADGGASSLADLPVFERPVLSHILRDLGSIPQMLSITGPRRVGKTTILRQIVRQSLREGQHKECIVYYSMDDPALFRPGVEGGKVLEQLMEELLKRSGKGKTLLLLDEIQRLDRWELYLKKYYDLKYPVRIVISGSASSPIFKKSRESLLGRVKDFHLLPFSFREFSLFHLSDQPTLLGEMHKIREEGQAVMGMFAADPQHLALQKVALTPPTEALWMAAENRLQQFVVEGGFPEVWNLPTTERKIEYLYDNQVKKVIYEDLVLAAKFRRPEQLKRFYLSLLERPGQEVSLKGIAEETGIGIQQVERYLPFLEMTDLVARVEKFRKSPLRVRRGNIKFYLVDLALRNAVLRLPSAVASEQMGLYAENLMFHALRKWPGILNLDFFREGGREVDFILHIRPGVYLPVEVKYRNQIRPDDLRGIRTFRKKFSGPSGLVITKRQADFGRKDDLFFLPLLHALLLFD